MSVFGVIGNVAREILRIGKIVYPIIMAFRDTVPEIDKVADAVDEGIAVAGKEADAFLDRNVEVLDAIEKYAGNMIDFAAQLRITVRFAKLASQDDIVTVAEGEVLARHVWELKDKALAFAGSSTEEVLVALKQLEESNPCGK